MHPTQHIPILLHVYEIHHSCVGSNIWAGQVVVGRSTNQMLDMNNDIHLLRHDGVLAKGVEEGVCSQTAVYVAWGWTNRQRCWGCRVGRFEAVAVQGCLGYTVQLLGGTQHALEHLLADLTACKL